MRRVCGVLVALVLLTAAPALGAGGWRLVAASGGLTFEARRGSEGLCLRLKAPSTDAGGCGSVPRNPFPPLVLSQGGAVAASVATVDLQRASGHERLPTIAVTGLPGRFFLSASAEPVDVVRLYDAAGTLVGAAQSPPEAEEPGGT